MFSLPLGALLHTLHCLPEHSTQADIHPVGLYLSGHVQVDLGKKWIAAVVNRSFLDEDTSDVVSVWSRSSGSLVFQGFPHPRGVSVSGLAVSEDNVLTGGGDGRVARIQKTGEGWNAELLEGRSGQHVTHMECRGRWGVVGGRREAQLWDMETMAPKEGVKPVTIKVTMLCFKHPHVFIIGGRDFGGIQVTAVGYFSPCLRCGTC